MGLFPTFKLSSFRTRLSAEKSALRAALKGILTLALLTCSAFAQSYDAAAEQHILDLANQSRAEAGLAPLKLDPGLTAAAREHSARMASTNQLSHDLPGEPALPQRLAATSKLELSGEAENVGYAPTPDESQNGFMHSQHHRSNLLDADYNLAGIGVVHQGNLIYVTQDFARAQLPHTPTQAANLTIAAVDQIRQQSGLTQLHVSDNASAMSAACAMAHADSLRTPAPHAKYVLRYTTYQPDALPNGAEQAIANRSLHSLTAGTCYARSATYPSGIYWVVLLLD